VLLLDVSLYHGDLAAPGLVSITDCASPRRVYTTGTELHLDLSGQQEPVLLLDMSTPQGTELHLCLSGQQEPVLLLLVSTLRGLSCTWSCLDNRSLCFT
jgi:hypothetical protein